MKEIFGLVHNGLGITSRISAELVAEANKATKCEVTLECGDETADLKSIMNMMSLIIKDQTEFKILIEGEDEEDVYDSFVFLLNGLRLLK